ncbi:hypothetical protein [Salmonella enterica]|uniref:hypothetical protein n=1 Tax=Salmonella enterica TaxID=28901 RepID=UPI00293C0CFA|nr:hypothetical protein [Salmonella enterica]
MAWAIAQKLSAWPVSAVRSATNVIALPLTVPGADEESDDELRERCRNQFNLVGNYHTDAVYRSMMSVGDEITEEVTKTALHRTRLRFSC